MSEGLTRMLKKCGQPLVILIGYYVVLFNVMVLKNVPLIRIGSLMLNFGGTQQGPPNLIPFSTIIGYLNGNDGLLISAINLLGNILLLVPAGFLVPFVLPKPGWKYLSMVAGASGLILELSQFILQVGIFDVDEFLFVPKSTAEIGRAHV